MLNGRIYRAAALPLLAVLAVAALSLTAKPAALAPALAPQGFDGARAAQELRSLATAYPDREPGSRGDERLAWHIAHEIEAAGASAGGGFRVSVHRFGAQTIAGGRSLLTVVASRAGSTDEAPIVVLAHRDSAHRGAEAELSGTAALLELARVLANQQTSRPIVLASTSGGSGGDAGAAELVPLLERSVARPGGAGASAGAPEAPGGAGEAQAGRAADAAIVLGDLASSRSRGPIVLPWSATIGSAPAQLAQTVASAAAQQAGIRSATPGLADQLAHFALPESAGEEGALNAAGIPAVTVQASGEAGPRPGAKVSAARLEALGSAVLASVDALDAAPALPAAPQSALGLGGRLLPEWALRLLVAALLLPAALVTLDAAARARRRREALARWLGFAAACALPFLAGAVFVRLIGVLGLAGADPGMPATPGSMGIGAHALVTVVLAVALFAVAWRYWLWLVRALGAAEPPRGPAAGVGLLLVLDATALLVWALNPFAALLLVPAAHLWLVVAAPELRPRRRGVAVAVVLLGTCAPLLLGVYLAHQLGMGAFGLAWTILLLVAGGHFSVGALLLGALALGCVVGGLLVALCGPGAARSGVEPAEITIRGPLSYAGPGSLGGTESALRR